MRLLLPELPASDSLLLACSRLRLGARVCASGGAAALIMSDRLKMLVARIGADGGGGIERRVIVPGSAIGVGAALRRMPKSSCSTSATLR